MAELIPNIIGFFVAIATFAVTILVLYRLMSKDMRERFDDMRKDMKERSDDMRKDMKERFDDMRKDTNERFDAMSRDTNERFDAMSRDTKERFDAMSRDTKERFDAMSRDTKERFDAMSKDTKERFDAMSKDTKERFDAMSRDTKERFDKVEESVKDAESRLTYRINRLESDVSPLRWDFTQSQKTAAPTASTSPITLTDVGEDIAKAVNARVMADKYVDKVEIPENADRFEIQQACFHFAMSEFRDIVSRDDQHLINEAVFTGVAAKLDMVYMVLGVLLRDYHLKERGFDVPVRKPEAEQTPPPQQSHPQD